MPIAQPRSAIPVLRVFDPELAYRFYRDFLGFEVAWEHRFEPGLPLYAEVRGYGVRLHLSEHHGDASPGAAVIIEVDDAEAVHRRLLAADYLYARPGVAHADWGLTVSVRDPFSNRIDFLQPSDPGKGPHAGQETVPPVEQEAAPPVEHEKVVAVDPDRAFEVFTACLGQWWDPRLTPCPDSFHGATVEPRVGGAVLLHHPGDGDFPIGTVTGFEPPARYQQEFTLGLEPAHPTRLTVTFGADEDGTRVHLAHGGWTAANVGLRSKFTEWPRLLERFAAVAEGRRPRA